MNLGGTEQRLEVGDPPSVEETERQAEDTLNSGTRIQGLELFHLHVNIRFAMDPIFLKMRIRIWIRILIYKLRFLKNLAKIKLFMLLNMFLWQK